MAVGYTEKQLDFIDRHKDFIGGRPDDPTSLFMQANIELGLQSAKKIIFAITYLLKGKEGFKLDIIVKGKSKSKARAEKGQMRFSLILKSVLCDDEQPYYLGTLKGTLTPSGLTPGICRNPLYKIFYQFLESAWIKQVSEVTEYVLSKANWPKV